MLCIIDANVLIDLNRGEILPSLFELPLRLVAPDSVLGEMGEPDRGMLLDMGLERADLTLDQLFEAIRISADNPHLSFADCSALVVARYTQALLLTGDAALRRLAEQSGVTVHGVLWILDQFEAAEIMEWATLHASLRQMLDQGARLPDDECGVRLRRWREA